MVLVLFTPIEIMLKERIEMLGFNHFFGQEAVRIIETATGTRPGLSPLLRHVVDTLTRTTNISSLHENETEKIDNWDEEKDVGIYFGHSSPFGMTLNIQPQVYVSEEGALDAIRRQLDYALKTGAKIVRVPVVWTEIQSERPQVPSDGRWWITDMWAREARQRNLDMLFRLDALRYVDCNFENRHWPGWKYGCPENGERVEAGMPRAHETGLPEDTDSWVRFVRELARRYGSAVKYYQVGNEADDTWAGTKEEYVELLRLTKEALYRENKELVLLHAGVLSGTLRMKMREYRGEDMCEGVPEQNCKRRTSFISFVDYVLRNGRTLPGLTPEGEPRRFGFDVADVHIYESADEVPELVETWKRWLQETTPQGVSVPHFWVTETGGPVNRKSPSEDYEELIASSEYRDRQFREVVVRNLEIIGSGVDKVFWYSMLDLPGLNSPTFRHVGLMTVRGEEKGSLVAYRLLTKSVQESGMLRRMGGLPPDVSGFEILYDEQENILFLYTKKKDDPSYAITVRIFGGDYIEQLFSNGKWKSIPRFPDGNSMKVQGVPLVLKVPRNTVVNFNF